MQTLGTSSTYCHTTIQIETHHPTEFIDLTGRLEGLVADAGIRIGFVNVQSLHTTTAIVVNEHEPFLLTDFVDCLDGLAPRDAAYQHDGLSRRSSMPAWAGQEERVNGHAHCQALLLQPGACLNVVDGRLLLGDWQRVFLAELDGPRERQISVVVIGEQLR
jgi:secondary thiamine-phosphate synthase enzyme